MKIRSSKWVFGFFALVFAALAAAAIWTVKVDPFFHYHSPRTDLYYYPLNNQRSQNNGIIRNFEYEGLITGTSVTENFKTSEAETLWNIPFIKVPFSGATLKEINDNLIIALKSNPDLHTVIRGLDLNYFKKNKDMVRNDMGTYPTYLYDKDPFNDVQYIFNRDVVFTRVYSMVKGTKQAGFQSGITSFDRYGNWMKSFRFGKDVLYPYGVETRKAGEPVYLTDDERELILDNIHQNITALADAYPQVSFYYFFTPFSVKWWQGLTEQGKIYEQIQAERIVIEEILKYPNIKLFSFSNIPFVTADLNNYKDELHYGEWVNSFMLKCMHDEEYLLTSENYESYLADELYLYTTFDYDRLNDQEDYENDSHAALVFAENVYGIEGRTVSPDSASVRLSHAEIIPDQYEGEPGVLCRGSLQRDFRDMETKLADFMMETDYIGLKFEIDDIGPVKYVVFYGRKAAGQGQPAVFVYDTEGKASAEFTAGYADLDSEWHEYIIDVSGLKGKASLIFNGGYTDATGSSDSQYIFSSIRVY